MLIEDTALIFENTSVHINLELKCNITLLIININFQHQTV